MHRRRPTLYRRPSSRRPRASNTLDAAVHLRGGEPCPPRMPRSCRMPISLPVTCATTPTLDATDLRTTTVRHRTHARRRRNRFIDAATTCARCIGDVATWNGRRPIITRSLNHSSPGRASCFDRDCARHIATTPVRRRRTRTRTRDTTRPPLPLDPRSLHADDHARRLEHRRRCLAAREPEPLDAIVGDDRDDFCAAGRLDH